MPLREWAEERGLTVAVDGAIVRGAIAGIKVVLGPQQTRPDGKIVRAICGFRLPAPVPWGLRIRSRNTLARAVAWWEGDTVLQVACLDRAVVLVDPGHEANVEKWLCTPSVCEPLGALLAEERVTLFVEKDLVNLTWAADPREAGTPGFDDGLALALALAAGPPEA